MATIAQIRAAAEAFRDTHLPKLVRRQAAYFALRGRYWQGIVSHVVIPDDGVATPPVLTRRPTDQQETWGDIFRDADALPATWPLAISVDVYDGPLGHGWTVTLIAMKGGQTFSRTWDMGPEGRDTGWIMQGGVS